ncbi:MAG: beta-galactosidase [Phycisphaerae bacterium]
MLRFDRRNLFKVSLPVLGALLTQSRNTKAAPGMMPLANPNQHVLNTIGLGLKPVASGIKQQGAVSPDGVAIRANNFYLEMGGKPLATVSGEFHPQRYPVEEWADAVQRMKAGGLNTVQGCFFWGQFEPRPGAFDFSGRNNVRYLAELCKKYAMHLCIRVGPYDNAEFLIGGMAPWLYGEALVERSNDPAYLKHVGRYYSKLGQQLKGMFFAEGGPIILAQLENELGIAHQDAWNMIYRYGASGYSGPHGAQYTLHYENLRKLAVDGGINAPFFIMTGWEPGGPFPDTLFPCFGAYMLLVPPRNQNSVLTTFNVSVPVRGKTPIIYVELGTGSPARINFRPMLPAQGALATAFAYLGGTETIALGYYMYHGGSNPMNAMYGFTPKTYDEPLISYDYFAPLGEFGEARESYFVMRPINNFVQNFGPRLADMEVRRQDQDVNNANEDRLRVACRAKDGAGFVFISNYADVHQLTKKNNQSFTIRTARGDIRIPHKGGLHVPAGLSGMILPFNMDMGHGVTLISATVQPLFQFEHQSEKWFVFFAPEGFRSEYVLDKKGIEGLKLTGAKGRSVDDRNIIAVKPSRGSHIRITAANGAFINIITLTQDDARHAIKEEIGGMSRIIISEHLTVADGQSITAYGSRGHEATVAIFPEVRTVKTPTGQLGHATDGLFGVYTVSQLPRSVEANVTPFQPPTVDEVLPAKQVPKMEAHEFKGLHHIIMEGASKRMVTHVLPAKQVVKIAPGEFTGLQDIIMEITYNGDVCRLFDISQGQLVADNLQQGIPWRVSLKRFSKALAEGGLLIRIESEIVGGADVLLAPGVSLTSAQRMAGPKAFVRELKFIPIYRFELLVT